MRGFGPKEWVYKGYGIFQYDLQAVMALIRKEVPDLPLSFDNFRE